MSVISKRKICLLFVYKQVPVSQDFQLNNKQFRVSEYLVCKLGHVVLQAALVVGLLTHLNQDVEVAVLLGQRCHPLVLTQIHCDTGQRHSRNKPLKHIP